jgi:glycosyltransferase involved in cell wall biosynthesis
LELWQHRPDIFIGLSQSLPLIVPGKSIVFVHDIAFDRFPDCYPGFADRLHRLTENAVRRATQVITVSESTKKDLINSYHVPADRIKVIYEGAGKEFFPQKNNIIKSVKSKYKITDEYFLYLGSLKRIKNIPNIIKAYQIFCRNLTPRVKLVLAGSDYWMDKQFKKIIIKELKFGNIIFPGFVKDRDLPALYSGALAFVSPALYEGFGIPLVEAMACGTPVITSDTACMPEITGGAALLVNPENPQDINDAMTQLTKNSDLRDNLREKGLKRSSFFTWHKTAENLLNQIEKL